jgi:hypothetical protein
MEQILPYGVVAFFFFFGIYAILNRRRFARGAIPRSFPPKGSRAERVLLLFGEGLFLIVGAVFVGIALLSIWNSVVIPLLAQ